MLPGIIPNPSKRLPPVGTYITYVTSSVNTVAGGSYSFASTAIGTASADRLVIAIVRLTGGAEPDGVTIGGIAATLYAIDFDTAIYVAPVPTGTTATIVVNVKTATSLNCGVGVYTLTGYSNPEPYDFGNIAVSGSHTVVSGTINVPEGGYLIAGHARTGTGTVTWNSPLVEDVDNIVETNNGRSTAHFDNTTGDAQNVTVKTTSSAAATFGKLVYASWE